MYKQPAHIPQGTPQGLTGDAKTGHIFRILQRHIGTYIAIYLYKRGYRHIRAQKVNKRCLSVHCNGIYFLLFLYLWIKKNYFAVI